MKAKQFATAVVLLLAFAAAALRGQETGARPELQALVTRIQEQLRAGKRSAAELAPELAAFDALRKKYGADKSADAARILIVEASLYRDVLDDLPRATELLKQVEQKFRGEPPGQFAAAELEAMERRAAALAAQAELIGKPAPEMSFTWSTRAGLKKLADLKGKVVVLDFWATWCGPCVATFPQIRELVSHYKDAEVAVIGVTSLQGRVHGLGAQPIDTRDDAPREFALMTDYIRAKDITWTIAFSEESVFNPAYGVNGIPHMAIIAPDGTLRYNGLHPGMPDEEKREKIDALLKEFGQRVP